MKKMASMLCISVIVTFVFAAVQRDANGEEKEKMAKVTGIGGVFFLARGEGKALASWYEKHLGMRIEDFGAVILKWEDDTAENGSITVWHIADRDSEWFSPSDSKFMINYRVDDLETMVEQLTASGIDILQGPEYHENGVFAWIMDPEGNKIELWEPMNWDDKNKRLFVVNDRKWPTTLDDGLKEGESSTWFIGSSEDAISFDARVTELNRANKIVIEWENGGEHTQVT